MNKKFKGYDEPIPESELQKLFKEKIIMCHNCNCMTHTKKGYIYVCGKCGKDRRRRCAI